MGKQQYSAGHGVRNCNEEIWNLSRCQEGKLGQNLLRDEYEKMWKQNFNL